MRRLAVELVENGAPVEVPLASDAGTALATSGFVDARPVPGTTLWSLRPLSKVGAVRIGGAEVHVVPKIPIDRVVALLEYTRAGVRWRTDTVRVRRADDLLTAVVEAFERLASRALQQGLLQGYRAVDAALPVVRGRIREADQLRAHFGLPVPVEVRYDDFTVDIAENRLLRAAVTAARWLPGLPEQLRHRLMRLDAQLVEVTPATKRYGLEPWRPTRLNARYHDALHLAEVILDAASFELTGTDLAVTGFVVDMAKVFEDFVCATLGARLRHHRGTVRAQDPWYLDRDREIRMRPDLVWYRDGERPTAVVDAKYKAEKPAGFPDADLYQMLAYCTALRLPVGHLVYAKGNEAGRVHRVAGAAVTLRAHAVDLSLPPNELLLEVDRIAAHVVAQAETPAAVPDERRHA